MRNFLAKTAVGVFLIAFAWLTLFQTKLAYAQEQGSETAPAESASAGGGIGATFKYLGVNMHDLTNEPEDKQEAYLSYLQKCNINTVRVFGLKEKAGGDGAAAIARTANIAQRYGIRIIAALGDYANGSENVPGDIRAGAGPGPWYGGGYVGSGYDSYVSSAIQATRGNGGILALELANEPHCNGFPSCFGNYVNWMNTIGQRLATSGFKVSSGMGTLGVVDNPTRGPYYSQVSQGAVNMMSTHWYPEDDPGKEAAMSQAAAIAKENGDEVILGEIGFECDSSPCTQSGNDEERARKMLQKMGEFSGYGYDGFLYWQFSGFKNGNYTANDPFSWFAIGPEDTENPFCKAFREGVVTPEEVVQPLLIYPRNSEEVGKYLANARVYCAPPQVFQPIDPSILPPLGPQCIPAGDLAPGSPYSDKLRETLPVCNETQYPIVRGDENIDFTNLSFPLFRNQNGGISIEADLAKVAPGETIAAALQRGGRSSAAPQFYLSSPETQCLNAVRYVQYAQRLCSTWTSGDAESCGANIPVILADGERVRLLDLAGDLNSESVCLNFSEEANQDTKLAKIVRSIQPYTPRVFKIGFLVQHTWLYDQGNSLLGQFLTEHIASWFGGTEDDAGFGQRRGEKLTISPVWYHAGITADEFDQFQTLPYSFDPTNLPDDPQSNPSNFAGPLWRTYSPLLPDYVQKSVATNRMEEIDKNYQFLQQILGRGFGNTGGDYIGSSFYSLFYDGNLFASNLLPITECTNKEDCLCIKSSDSDQCQNELMEDLQKSFPEDFDAQPDYLLDLKKQVVARVNAGVQVSEFYPANLETSYGGTGVAGPLSSRSFSQCSLDLDNKLLGESESAQSILSAAIQALNDVNTEPTPENVRKAITSVSSNFVSKIVTAPFGWVEKLFAKRTTRAYLVLPDEAMNIDIAQAYITPMFMSPEMYESVVTGQNEIYPFNLDENGEPKSSDEQKPLSAFLRTIGLSRSVETEQAEGYMQMRTIQYGVICDDPADPGNCRCSSTAVSQTSDPVWVEYDPDPDTQEPSIENGCVKREIEKESVVDVSAVPTGKSPNFNPQTPGQLQALNEFLRRAVFTPLHQQAYLVYPGLEQFYLGTGTTSLQPPEQGSFPINNACVYKEPREIIPSIKSNAELTNYICSQTGDPNIAALTLAIWRIEGGRARNSIDTGGNTPYTCAPNRSGAIPPMNFVIGICSDGRIDPSFRADFNTLTPDLCQVQSAITAGIQKISGDYSFVSRQNSSLSPSNPTQLKELFARASHLYIGTGYNCGDYRDDDDGTPLSGGGGLDYCGYAAVRAMSYLSTLPASCR